MRSVTKTLIPLLVLAMVGIADAKGVKKTAAPLIKGRIASITDGNITLTSGRKNTTGTKKVVSTTAQTLVTINGVAGKRISDLLPGQTVVITACAGTATEITATNAKSTGRKLRKV